MEITVSNAAGVQQQAVTAREKKLRAAFGQMTEQGQGMDALLKDPWIAISQRPALGANPVGREDLGWKHSD